MPQSTDLWAIACHFNPVGFRRRVQNYRVFREQLRVPLVTVELAFDREFELGPDDAEVMIQLRSPDVMWHKERLLSIALEALPETVGKVAWLDTDVVFPDPCWHERTSEALDSFSIVQAFSRLHDLQSEASPATLAERDRAADRYSLVYMLNTGMVSAEALSRPSSVELGYAVGFAWAARAELLRTHGFYDTMILGSGDKVSAGAAFGALDESMDAYAMSPRQRDHYLEWARPFWREIDGRVGHVEQEIVHLWHGDLRNRLYGRRYRDLAPFDFDPYTDIARDENDCWRWSSEKPEMHDYVRRYFASRREDGGADDCPSDLTLTDSRAPA